MKLTIIALTLAISGCSANRVNEQITEEFIKVTTGKDVSDNSASCPTLKQQCGVLGDYQEWEQPNGKLACACN